jgi:pilus assembly protein TadC
VLAYLARWAGELFDVTPLWPVEARDRLTSALAQSNLRVTAGEWLALCTLAPLLLAGFAALGAYAHAQEGVHSLAALLLALVLSLALLWRHPFGLARARALRLEAELPFALRELALELRSRTPFEQALARLAEGPGPLAREISRVLQDVERGAAAADALKAMSGRVDSLELRRAVAQLSLAYAQGSNTEGLRKLADELAALQRAQAREYHARLSLVGLVFIALACIIPSLFAAYVIVGSSFLDLSFTPNEVYLAYLALFPAVDALVLAYARRARPAALGG